MDTLTQHLDSRPAETILAPTSRRVSRFGKPKTSVVQPSLIQFATIRERAGLETLRTEWCALFSACGRPHQVFQTFEWLSIWADLYLGRATRLCIVTGRIEGRLVMVWPLVTNRVFGLRLLCGMGEPLSQYGDALIAPEVGDAGEDAAFAYLSTLPADVLSFRRVRDDAAIAPMLRRTLQAADQRQASPVVDFTGTPDAEAFEQRFSGKLRSSRRRRRRRLNERGAVTFTSHGPSPEAMDGIVTALAFKRDWARRSGVISPALRDPRFERFFVAAASGGTGVSGLRVSVLRCGSEVVGVEISVGCKGHLFGHVLAPHPGLDTLGLGGLLAEQTILGALSDGYETLDLLAPADAYKVEWTAASVGVGDYSLALGPLGALYARVWLRFGREAIKHLVNRFSARSQRRA